MLKYQANIKANEPLESCDSFCCDYYINIEKKFNLDFRDKYARTQTKLNVAW